MTTDAPGSVVSSPRRVDGHDGAASRTLIVGVVVVVVIWIMFVAAFRSTDFSARLALSSVKFLLAAAALAASVGALLGLLRRSEPPRFLVREGSAFVMPPSRACGYLIVAEVLFVGLVANFAIDQWATPGDGDRAHAVIDAAFAVSASVMAVIMGGIATVMVAFVLSERSSVRITPRAVGRPGLLRSRTIPWEALRPGVRPQLDGGGRTVTLTIDRPELAVTVGLVYTSGNPRFLADAIQFYLDHPDRRDAIGTRAEYERLLRNLNDDAGHGGSSTD